jgi:two-component system phosphate regulon sensor histidine kinase PhoR
MAYRELAAWRPNRSVVRLIGSFTSTEGDQAAGEPSRRATAILRDVSAAQALAELREGFVATVSHELRTPLALIKGYADTLLHLEIDDESRGRFVERIQASTEQLTRLVNDVLDIARLDADPLVLERAPIQIGAIVARLRDDLGDSGGADRLRVRISQRLPPVEADGARIGQVLDNLISNARKYAPGDTPITVSARVDGDTVVTSVEDRGIGIPTGDEELVFEPFHRGRNVRELSTPGTGLGLHISRRIVAAHGGRLWLERTESGTRVSFSLPMLVPAQSRPSAWAQGDG